GAKRICLPISSTVGKLNLCRIPMCGLLLRPKTFQVCQIVSTSAPPSFWQKGAKPGAPGPVRHRSAPFADPVCPAVTIRDPQRLGVPPWFLFPRDASSSHPAGEQSFREQMYSNPLAIIVEAISRGSSDGASLNPEIVPEPRRRAHADRRGPRPARRL